MKKAAVTCILIFVVIFLFFNSGSYKQANTLSTFGFFHSGTDSDEIQLVQDDILQFTYKSWSLIGNINMKLINPNGAEVLDENFHKKGEIIYRADIEGTYKIEIKKSGVACIYSVTWGNK